MEAKHSSVVNFVLSKDFHEKVRLRIHSLRGLTTASLYSSIYEEQVPNTPNNDSSATNTHRIEYMSVLIEQKVKNHLLDSEIFTEVHIESGIGKRLTNPITIGLICDDKETEHLFKTDNSVINFTVSDGCDPSSKMKPHSTFSTSEKNNTSPTWVSLPIEYSKLPRDATMVLTNWCHNVKSNERLLLNTGRMKLFTTNSTLVQGKHKVSLDMSTTSSDEDAVIKEIDSTSATTESMKEEAVRRIENSSGRPQWLDKMTVKKLEDLDKMMPRIRQIIPVPVIVLEILEYDVPIVFSDTKYVPILLPRYEISNSVTNYDPSFNAITYMNIGDGNIENNVSEMYMTDNAPFDPDQFRDEHAEDPIEQKFRRLERMQHLSPSDRGLKPTSRIREALAKVMRKQFFEKLTAKERNMVWRYRWFILNMIIVGNPGMSNSLINFIKCVDWNNIDEIREFDGILRSLETTFKLPSRTNQRGSGFLSFDIFISKLQIVDCLELLSSNYRNPLVRGMAVKRLKYFSDVELSMFMVQLVQMIKNEPLTAGGSTPVDGHQTPVNKNDDIQAEDDYAAAGKANTNAAASHYTMASSDFFMIENNIDEKSFDSQITEFIDLLLFNNKKAKKVELPYIRSDFINYLIERSVNDSILTNHFYWCLKVELDEEKRRNRTLANEPNPFTANINMNAIQNTEVGAIDRDMANGLNHIHQITLKRFLLCLLNSEHGKEKLYELRRQIELVTKLHRLCYAIKIDHKKEPTPRKVEILKHMLTEKQRRTIFGSKFDSRKKALDDARHESMLAFPPLAMPLDPSVFVNGTIPEESSVFKSSLNPLKITFQTTQNTKYPIMYKIGDDLRQDQFISQIITLMEKILEGENMDLRLRAYKILATGEVEGFIQFIPNNSLSHILARYNNSILLYLQTFNPDPTAHLGVNPQVMDNYVRSCAGYCVVTYILGVGDRHLENLLLTKDGHFFHADFGYILGQDPKPFPPLMKLPIQIISGMGGSDDINYKSFCQYCFITYLTLRKNAPLILNLVQLMINTSIPALRTSQGNSEAEKLELLWKVEEKFMLDMNDEEAVLHFQNLIDSSVNAVIPVVIDRLHNLAQYWRS